MVKIRRQDVRLSQSSLAAARQCLEAGYIVGMGTEATLALCAGVRDACGIEAADETMFEEDVARILYRAMSFTRGMAGFEALKAEKLVDELERLAMSGDGQDRIWDSLAAAVGDAEPSEANLRVIAIFRALRGGNAMEEIEPQKSPRPSKAKRTEAILKEREAARVRRETSTLPDFPLPSDPGAEIVQTSPSVESSPREPGKIACRLLAYLHQGYVLVDREGLPGSGASTSRLLPARPRFDRDVAPRYLLEYDEDYRQKHYDRDYGWELEWAGWITDVRGFGDHVYCLTPAGAQAAIRMFGESDVRLPSLDPEQRKLADAAIEKLVDGHTDEEALASDLGVSPQDMESILDQVRWFGDDEELCAKLDNWRTASRATRKMAV